MDALPAKLFAFTIMAGLSIALPAAGQGIVPIPLPAQSGSDVGIDPSPRVSRHQHLVPSPYEGSLGPNALGSRSGLNPSPRVSRHQHLVPTPYERSLGPNALGNPKPQYRTRHQQRVRTPYPRQYQ
ncbi:MAG: hypothetical protein JWM36_51 [Hyphomicrobiales bacterium]|nr:hypothetical protein [Hyphomicrobiales bacterium]